MKKRYWISLLLIVIVALVVLVLGWLKWGWFGGDKVDDSNLDLSSSAKVYESVGTDCKLASRAVELLERGDPVELRKYQLKVDPLDTDEEQQKVIAAPLAAAQDIVLVNCSNGPSQSPTPTESPSASASATQLSEPTTSPTISATKSASSSPTPTFTKTIKVTMTVTAAPVLGSDMATWRQVLDVASPELEAAGVSLDDAEKWANFEGPNGEKYDPRLILNFESDLDEEEARAKADVNNAQDPLPVLQVSTCIYKNGEPCASGVLVIYTPLQEVVEDGGTVVKFDLGSGIWFNDKGEANEVRYIKES